MAIGSNSVSSANRVILPVIQAINLFDNSANQQVDRVTHWLSSTLQPSTAQTTQGALQLPGSTTSVQQLSALGGFTDDQRQLRVVTLQMQKQDLEARLWQSDDDDVVVARALDATDQQLFMMELYENILALLPFLQGSLEHLRTQVPPSAEAEERLFNEAWNALQKQLGSAKLNALRATGQVSLEVFYAALQQQTPVAAA